MHEEKTARLLAVQQRLCEAGKSTRDAGRDKKKQALLWLYRWGWSSPRVIDALNGTTNRGLCTKLERAKLVHVIRSASGDIEGIPGKIVTLSRAGLDEVYRLTNDLHDYTTDPYRVNQTTLRHDINVQHLTLQNLHSEKIAAFTTPLEMAEMSQRRIKQPNVIWILKDGRRLAVHLELSPRFGQKLDEFVDRTLHSISENRFDQAAVISPSEATLKRYRASFEPGKEVCVWGKDGRGHWRVGNRYAAPEWSHNKVFFWSSEALDWDAHDRAAGNETWTSIR